MKYDLCVVIPGRREEFISRTIEDVLKNRRGKTQVIAGLDEKWAEPPIKDHEDVIIYHTNKAIGQRAMTNRCVELSDAKYIMKLDAHCMVSEGFDLALLEGFKKLGDNVVQIPVLYNLHAFNWKCKKCGNEWYQGPTPTHCQNPGEQRGDSECDGKEFERVMVWKPRFNRKSEFYRFDPDLHFQYHADRKKHPEAVGDYPETMSAQGSCFVVSREKYWELNICDESWGSWGNQGSEVACKTWLSGGRLVTNRKCWYSHLFRTQGGDFSFPYPQSGKQVDHARKTSQDLFLNNKWEMQIRPLSWLVEKFWLVPGWNDKDLAQIKSVPFNLDKGNDRTILFYTDNQLNLQIAHKVQKQLKSIGLPIVSVSLKPMTFGQNIYIPRKRGYVTMAKQILAGLEAIKTKYVFFCEHDVVYSPSHFDFTPPRDDVYYYNTNVWKIRYSDRHCVRTDDCKQLSGLCCSTELALQHFRKKVKQLEERVNDPDFNKFVRKCGFEPGTHRRPERTDDFGCDRWESKIPNLDIRHDKNLTSTRWSPEEFVNKKFTDGWREADQVEGWDLKALALK